MSKPKKGDRSAPASGESPSAHSSTPPSEAGAEAGKAAEMSAPEAKKPKKKGARKASPKTEAPAEPEPAKRRGRPKRGDEKRQVEARPEELKRAISLLDQLVEAFGGSRRHVDKLLGTGRSRTSQLLSGRLELKFQHILDVLDVLGIETRAFFEVLYGEEEHAPFPAPLAVVYRQKLRAMGVSADREAAGPKLPEPPQVAQFLTEEEVRRLIDERLFEAFRHVMPVLKKPPKGAVAAETPVPEPKSEPVP